MSSTVITLNRRKYVAYKHYTIQKEYLKLLYTQNINGH